MVIQNIVFDDNKPEELFYHGNIIHADNHIIKAGTAVKFDTYFNSFHAVKWNGYTYVSDININVGVKGKGKITLFAATTDGEIKALGSLDFDKPESEDVSFDNYFPIDTGCSVIYFSVEAETDVEIASAAYVCSLEEKRELNIACCFCTFRREKELTYNVNNILDNIIRDKDSVLYGHCRVFVADNGHTISSDMFSNDENILIFDNPNYGGSAGFTRCMIESCIHRKGEFTHIILMDDDAVIESYVIEKTAVFLSLIKEEFKEYMLGGALFPTDRPNIQHENGAVLDKLFDYDLLDTELDMTCFENVVSNSRDDREVSYNGWWYTVIPSSFVTEDNLPLPLFIHCDDQEYGMRSNNRFIRLNGVCAWHPEGSIVRPYMVYYDYRNKMIASAHLGLDISSAVVIKQIIKKIFGSIISYLPEKIYYYQSGFIDFYKGFDNFLSVNPENLNRVLINGKNYKSVRLEKTLTLSAKLNHTSTQRNALTALNFFLIPVVKYRAYDFDAHTYDINYLFTKKIMIVQKSGKTAIVLEKKYSEIIKAIAGSIKTSVVIMKCHKDIYPEWQEKSKELSTYDFWKKYLNLDGD